MNVEELTSYEILEDRMISDVASRGMILRHKKTGARIAVLSNQDDNKVFYIAFRTTPADETGVPHIIEHTTLCGSAKYPVKDPFIELAKGSLNTFLNAMTYPDKTMYPIASYNDQDFKNLMDVYLDAVFHPNITRCKEIFMQEGWRYELEDPEAPLMINGVVYNEMKGAYSSPEEVLQSAIMRSLFPDNTYGKDSGGNPQHIPELTYEAYLDFYHTYYHPSNSYIYLYGDMDVAERLEYLDREYLSAYDFLKVDSEIPMQAAFEKETEAIVPYAIGSEDSDQDMTYLAWNRVIGTSLDARLYMAFDILNYALVSAPGAPVRKALIDAGIGEDVTGQYDGSLKQPVFTIMAQNTNLSEKERFLSIIHEELAKAAETGINKEALLAGINSSEFRFRESDFGQFPKGLLYGISCMDSWLYDDLQPFMHLECLDHYEWLRRQIGTGYFEDLVRNYLLSNTHGSLVSVVPDRNKLTQDEERDKNMLAEKKASMTPSELEQLAAETKAFRRYQEAPETPEGLLSIPMLQREDLRREAMRYDNTFLTIDEVPVLLHEIPTNGIDYISLFFNVDDLTEDELGLISLMASIQGLIDTTEHTYAEFANAVDIHTGGIYSNLDTYSDSTNPAEVKTRFQIRIKVLSGNLEKAIDLTKEMLLGTKLEDKQRLRQILASNKARLQEMLAQYGNMTAKRRGCSYFSEASRKQDLIRGLGYYHRVCRAEKQIKEEPEKLILALKNVSEKVFDAKRLMISFTGEKELYNQAETSLKSLIAGLPEKSPVGPKQPVELIMKNEGITDASRIQYVAKCGNFTDAGFRYTGKLRLLQMILTLDYLWNEVRVKGGAYGTSVSFLRNGDSAFTSFRDPNLRKTLERYDQVVSYISSFDPGERDMTKYVIGTFGSIDTPMNPEAKGMRSVRAYLENVSYEQIQRERDEIRTASAADIRGLADLVQAVLDKNAICVFGNENQIRKDRELFGRIIRLQNDGDE